MLIVLAGLVVAVGALVQGAVGFGQALIAVPLLAIIDPSLVPAPLLVVGGALAVLGLHREYSDVDWRGVSWAVGGRLPGIALGVLAVATLPARAFAVVVALAVLGSALLSAVRWRLRPTPPALVVAGLVSGTVGTAAAIGGPPVALLYQHSDGARVRATMAAYFTVGTVLSLVALAVAGEFTADGLRSGLLLLPFTVAGFLASGPVRGYLDRGWTRTAVIVLAVTSALVLLLRALLS